MRRSEMITKENTERVAELLETDAKGMEPVLSHNDRLVVTNMREAAKILRQVAAQQGEMK
jgi:signal peptidase I